MHLICNSQRCLKPVTHVSYRTGARNQFLSTVLVSMRCSSRRCTSDVSILINCYNFSDDHATWQCTSDISYTYFVYRIPYVYRIHRPTYFAEYWQIVIFFSDGYSTVQYIYACRLQLKQRGKGDELATLWKHYYTYTPTYILKTSSHNVSLGQIQALCADSSRFSLKSVMRKIPQNC